MNARPVSHDETAGLSVKITDLGWHQGFRLQDAGRGSILFAPAAQEAAAEFGARYWAGLEGPNVDHVAVCGANEAWLRGEIARGSHIIDIGIDNSRKDSRSPYYELEQRIIAETGYPVERRPWPPSRIEYEPEDPGRCP